MSDDVEKDIDLSIAIGEAGSQAMAQIVDKILEDHPTIPNAEIKTMITMAVGHVALKFVMQIMTKYQYDVSQYDEICDLITNSIKRYLKINQERATKTISTATHILGNLTSEEEEKFNKQDFDDIFNRFGIGDKRVN